jgi:hypothetical protein
MAAVAFVAIFTIGWVEFFRYRRRLDRLAFDYFATAAAHSRKGSAFLSDAEVADRPGEAIRGLERLAPRPAAETLPALKGYRENAAHLRRLAAYEKELETKYLRARDRPWLPIPPDPPEPE